MTDVAAVAEIRTQPRPHCALCGSGGKFIYQSLSDRLFGAPGTWDLKKCSNPKCGLIWLDPMPLNEDIGKAYASYYTHEAPQIKSQTNLGLLRRCYRLVKQAYLKDRYGYDT